MTRVAALDDTLTTRVDLGPMARAMWAAARGALTQAAAAGASSAVAAVVVATADQEEEEEERKKMEDGVDDALRDAFTNLDPCFLLQ